MANHQPVIDTGASPKTPCRFPSCRQYGRSTLPFYCPGHWRSLVSALSQTIDGIYGYTAYMYIGRTNYPERRLLQHVKGKRLEKNPEGAIRTLSGRPYLMTVLHWSADWWEIDALERTLVGEHKGRRKIVNIPEDSKAKSGDWDGAWNCTYLLWTPRDQSYDAAAARFRLNQVERLDARLRIPPTFAEEGIVPQPVHLEYSGSPEQAKEELTRLKAYYEHCRSKVGAT